MFLKGLFWRQSRGLLALFLLLISGCSLVSSQPTDEPETVKKVDKKPVTVSEQLKVIPEGEIRGVVSYRERIALLSGAFVRVVLIQEGKKAEPPQEISEQIFHPTGQVPFEYRLKFEPEDIRGGFQYAVKGQIFSEDERLLFASETPVPVEPLGPKRQINLPLIQVPITHQSHMKPVTAAISRVFQCGDFAFGTRTGIGEIALYLPEGVVVLSQVRSASGVRYQEGDTLFWMKDDQAMLSHQGAFYRQCLRNTEREARDPIERRPVDFRAIGQQPTWLLEIVNGHNLNLITEYGQKRVQLPEPDRVEQYNSVIFRAKDDQNRVSASVRKEPCQLPAMEGQASIQKKWPDKVSVWWNGRHYKGCGEYLD